MRYDFLALTEKIIAYYSVFDDPFNNFVYYKRLRFGLSLFFSEI